MSATRKAVGTRLGKTRSRGACRKPTLADLLILVAALGIGFGATRPWVSLFGLLSERPPLRYLARLFCMSIPCGIAATFAWMAIRWRMPRPKWLRLMRQPGLFACCGSLIIASVGFSHGMAIRLLMPENSGTTFEGTVIRVLGDYIVPFPGYGVLVSWGLLLVSGRWRRERGWIDATGIVLGVYWVIISISTWVGFH